MSAAQTHAIHAALTETLEGMRNAGQFRTVALADSHGLMWAVAGDLLAPDRLAALPSLISRAFTDRQPLLRFYSDKGMRFEYRSDTLAYIKAGVEGVPSGADFLLDVPGEKPARGGRAKAGRGGVEALESREFVIQWDDEYLVLRNVCVQEEDWCVMGLSGNPSAARTALQKGAPIVSGLLNGMTRESLGGASRSNEDMALHARMNAELEGFRDAAPEIHLAAVTSKDGFVVAALAGAVEADMVAPLIGHSFLAIQESTQRLCGDTECVMLRMDEGILLARELTDDLLFAALLAPTACTGLILTAFEAAATGLRSALNSMVTSAPTQQGIEAVV